MKKIFMSLAMLLISLSVFAQNKSSFQVLNCGSFKIHVYNSNDVMADASYIIEGKKSIVLMEVPLFKVKEAEFSAYVKKLNKPVATVITDYHLGGSKDKTMTMPEGMPAFIKGPVYGGMMKHFSQIFGDAMVDLPSGTTSEVSFGSTKKLAGVAFKFNRGASSDFPAASIIIGGKAYYTHWTPSKAHISSLQISSKAAIDAEIEEATKELNSGCEYFLGGHGGAATKDAVAFKIEYLKKMKELVNSNSSADAFVSAMKLAYPGLPGENGLQELGKALYK